WCAPPCHNDVDLEPDEFGSDLGEALFGTFRPAVLDCDGAALDPAKLTQPLQKSGNPWSLERTRARAQEPNRLRRLLRARLERPRCRAGTEQRDELASPHVLLSRRGSYPTTSLKILHCSNFDRRSSGQGQNENSPILGLCQLLPPAPDIGLPIASAALCQKRL